VIGRRLDVAFSSAGDECRGWLFMPDAESSALVILGHGLGATREFGLEPYARRFADAGIAALAFTYRHFGDSGGRSASGKNSQARHSSPDEGKATSSRVRVSEDV